MPVAMKAISPQVTHRAAAGLVGSVSAIGGGHSRARGRRIETRAASKSVALDGIYVQKMEPEGIELLVSAFRDPSFGVMISIGAGGVMTELIDDATLAPAPLSEAAAARALESSCDRAPGRRGAATAARSSDASLILPL